MFKRISKTARLFNTGKEIATVKKDSKKSDDGDGIGYIMGAISIFCAGLVYTIDQASDKQDHTD